MIVSLSPHSPETVLPAYVRALEALPNLHTLQVICKHHKITAALKGVFGGHFFPQVRTIALSGHAYPILRCCREVRKVICMGYDAGKLASTIWEVCWKVEEVEGFGGSEKAMKSPVLTFLLLEQVRDVINEAASLGLVKAAPNLRSIKFHYFASSVAPPFTLVGT